MQRGDARVTDQAPEGVALPLRWVGVEETPLLVANQFLGQVVGPGEVILNFGAVMPPPILPGTPVEELQEYTYVPVTAAARLGLNRTNLEQLIGVLQQTLANHDQVVQAMGELER
jgi:hypothetical protein